MWGGGGWAGKEGRNILQANAEFKDWLKEFREARKALKGI